MSYNIWVLKIDWRDEVILPAAAQTLVEPIAVLPPVCEAMLSKYFIYLQLHAENAFLWKYRENLILDSIPVVFLSSEKLF